MAQFQQQLSAAIPAQIRHLLGGNSRHELLKQVEDVILLFDQSLYRHATGDYCQVSDSESAAAIASAARQLLGDVDKDHGLMLLLPPQEFVATSQSMPGISKDSLFSALDLQSDSLLPACEIELALAVNPASAEMGEEHTALWMSQSRLDDFYEEFAAQGLFLTAVRPRPLGVAGADAETRLIDNDQQGPTAVAINNGVIMQWLQVDCIDLEDENFSEQWQQELKSHPTAGSREFNSAQDYLGQLDVFANEAYSFIPSGALQARKKVEQGRKLMAAAAILVFLGFLSAIPFLMQSLEFRQAASALAQNRSMSSEARADQAVVVNFENEWGPINDFPQQNIPEAMFTLQEALAPDQLSSLEISEGLISIQGISEAPQAILQRLEQDPLFTEAVFARATNNARYYIDLRLSPVNFESYMLRYFPDE